MIVHREFQQGSLAWLQCRLGVPTASEFKNIVTGEFKPRTGEMVRTYIASKLAEAWQGAPLPGFSGFDIEQGSLLEDEAIPWLELELNTKIERVGFCTTDDGRIGASPDGLMGETGVEVKCPQATAHVKYLLGGVVPDEYLPQVHGGMLVTGFKSWTFLSYNRAFPKLVLTVERDEAIQQRLTEALTRFLAAFDEGMARLVEINGGPPPKRRPILAQPTFVSETPT